ncbi:MAG: undecaprenyl-diphosphate phosphatase [Bacteroidales bacterium]|nr:undecaprenyl-diphosphate phosphatase [Bacteroidales bacterium]
MEWWQALILGIVQGLTEFLPVSSSGHLMIFKELLGVDAEGFLDFTVTVHFATVLSTVIVFWSAIWSLLKGIFKFRYNDETDYVAKLIVSMVPVAVVGLFFKDSVEALFGESLFVVAISLIITALLLFLSDNANRFSGRRKPSAGADVPERRNGISFLQAFVVGLGQACAVAPGLSRSGTTIATGLLCGVKRDVMAQFSFLMVLVPILGEQLLSVIDAVGEGAGLVLPVTDLLLGFIGAFVAGLVSCKAMVAIVRKARLTYFALYCLVVALMLLLFA